MIELQQISQPRPTGIEPIVWYSDSTGVGEGATSLGDRPCSVLSQLFTPDRCVVNQSIGGQNSTQIADRFIAAPDHQKVWPHVFNFGRIEQNDTPAQYIADLTRVVAAMKTSRFLLCTPTNGDYGDDFKSIGAKYAERIAVRDHMLATWPDNVIDLHQTLLDAYDDQDADDVADYAEEIVPGSLRNDPIHPNSAGYLIMATLAQTALVTKGW